MKITLTIILFTLTGIIVSCDKETPEPRIVGEITISSERRIIAGIYEISGYSFEFDKPIKVLTGSEDAGLIPGNFVNNQEIPVGMKFSTSTLNPNGYYLNGTFSDLAAATNFFNAYLTADAPSLKAQSDTIKAFQVHTFQNSRGNWVKILVKDLRAINPGNPSGYYEADIRFIIQRDGTQIFPRIKTI